MPRGSNFFSRGPRSFGVIESQRVQVNLAAPTQTLKPSQSGQLFICAVDAVLTLPTSSPDIKGVTFGAMCGALSTGVGLSLSPAAADAIGGNGLTVVVDKDLINSGASDRLGDLIWVICTGETGATAWRIVEVIGTWAKES